jgi:short-subunit dehydrogenase
MHVAITGASSGLGEALAREYAQAGATLTLVARRKDLLETLAAELRSTPVRVVPWDLGDPERATGWVDAAEAELGPIDVLLNNAGMDNPGPTAAQDPALIDRILKLNLHTPMRLSVCVLKRMLEAGRAGTIVNVTSVAGLAAPPLQTFYGASKAGLAMFSETLRREHRRTPVNVLTVYPGPIPTAMSDAAYLVYGGREGKAGAGPEGKPEVFARKVRRAVDKRSARVIYPSFYALSRYLPWLAQWVSGQLVDGRARLP